MYRHHDHLHSWVSGFQKVLDSKDVCYLSQHREAPSLFYSKLKELLALKWSCGAEGELLLTTVRLSCVPAQCVFMKCEYSLVWLSS